MDTSSRPGAVLFPLCLDSFFFKRETDRKIWGGVGDRWGILLIFSSHPNPAVWSVHARLNQSLSVPVTHLNRQLFIRRLFERKKNSQTSILIFFFFPGREKNISLFIIEAFERIAFAFFLFFPFLAYESVPVVGESVFWLRCYLVIHAVLHADHTGWWEPGGWMFKPHEVVLFMVYQVWSIHSPTEHHHWFLSARKKVVVVFFSVLCFAILPSAQVNGLGGLIVHFVALFLVVLARCVRDWSNGRGATL